MLLCIYILGDFGSDYKTRLFKLCLLPLMMHFEILDILFFVSGYQNPTNTFDIKNYVEFLTCNTHASRTFKIRHLQSSNSSKHHSYFSRLPRLWNSSAPINPSFPIVGIRTKLRTTLKLTLKATLTLIIHVLCTLDAPVAMSLIILCSIQTREADRSYWVSLRTVITTIT